MKTGASIWITLRTLLGDLPEVECRWHEPLASYTTFRVGGPAFCLARPQTTDALVRLVELLRSCQVPHFVLGGGSNLLLPDEEVKAVVIQLDQCASDIFVTGKGVDGKAWLAVGAGVRLARLQRYCLQHRFGGMEFLVGIPGTVGGAAFMNAGTSAGSIADALLWVDLLDGENRRQRLPQTALSASYRSLGPADESVILVAVGCYRLCPRPTARQPLAVAAGTETDPALADALGGLCVQEPFGACRRRLDREGRSQGLPHWGCRGLDQACQLDRQSRPSPVKGCGGADRTY